MVCPTLTAPIKMVHLEERVSTISEKRSIVATALTHTVSDSERVFSNDLRSLICGARS